MVMQDGTRHSRGRPRSLAERQVYDDLVLAAYECLRVKLHTEITTKDIASRAGTGGAMIQYYFGGKDGLIYAVVEKVSTDLHDRLRELETTILTLPGCPVRHLIKTLVESYVANSHICRVTLCEYQKSSSLIKDQCFERLSRNTVSRVHAILKLLVDRGVYPPEENIRYLSLVIVGLSIYPVVMSPLLSPGWLRLEDCSSDAWVDYLTDLIDRRRSGTDGRSADIAVPMTLAFQGGRSAAT